MLPKIFTGFATPLILLAYFITVFYPTRKRLWSSIALLGATSQLIGGVLYQDYGIVVLESVFAILNIIALRTTFKG